MYFNSCSLYGDFVVVVLIIKAIQLSFIWRDYKLFSSQKEVSDGHKLSRVEIAPLQIVRAKQYYTRLFSLQISGNRIVASSLAVSKTPQVVAQWADLLWVKWFFTFLWQRAHCLKRLRLMNKANVWNESELFLQDVRHISSCYMYTPLTAISVVKSFFPWSEIPTSSGISPQLFFHWLN